MVVIYIYICISNLVGGLEHEFYDFPIILGMKHHPNWRIPSFVSGVGWNHQPVITKVSLVHICESLICEQYNIIIHNRTIWWMIKSTMYLFWPKWLNATISGVGLNHQPVIISSSHDGSTTGAFPRSSWERGLSRTGRPEWHAADAAVPVWSPWKERWRRSAEDFWVEDFKIFQAVCSSPPIF